MKFFIAFVTLVAGLAIANPLAAENLDGEMAAQGCLKSGAKCKANGSMGTCCSKLCIAQGSKVGKCK